MAADGWAGFIATEISSRAGDPHLHVHCTLPNVLVGRDGVGAHDGRRWPGAGDQRAAVRGLGTGVRHGRGQARGLLGEVWFNPAHAQWEVGGFSDETLTAFSRGRSAVLAEDEDLDDARPVTARARSARNRAAKGRATAAKSDDQPTWGQLREQTLAPGVAPGPGPGRRT